MPIRRLPVPLSEGERLAHGQELARLIDLEQQTEEKHKSIKAGLKEEMDGIQVQIRAEAKLLTEGHEDREIDVEDVFDHESLKVHVRRIDNYEIILTRDMTEDERVQSRLPFEPKGRRGRPERSANV